ncbi:MAG: ADP-ribosylglycohydrolase family protein, partial [Nanoarchaeota archaeon]|nr:ADP-ribosylglycohydrolase family protein [Nanoarchaeota archaeon]
MAELQDKFKGCLFGLAIGDALGFPVEFLTLGQIKEYIGKRGVQNFQTYGSLPEGAYSDDTQMTLATAGALISSKTDDVETIMREMREQYIAWLNSPDNNRALGATCTAGVKNMENGIYWRISGSKDSKGCGAAMRTAPIGLLFHDNLPKLCEIASAASICTHAHPTGIASGIATAYLTALAVNNTPPENMIQLLC